MKILKFFKNKSEEHSKGFLLCGGHAVNFHGFSRTTADIDLVVRKVDKDFWRESIEELGYACYHDHNAFQQFSPSMKNMWHLDLMLVEDETFNKLIEDSLEVDVEDISISIVSRLHIIAMKLHALRENYKKRKFKDIPDILELSRMEGIELGSEKFKNLCLKYANIDIYNKLLSEI